MGTKNEFTKCKIIIFFAIVVILTCLCLSALIEKYKILDEEIPSSSVDVFRFVYEYTSILNVAAAIVVAGLAIASPLYIFLWQSLTDSIFHFYLETNNQYRDYCNKEKKEELGNIRKQTLEVLGNLEDDINYVRKVFGIILWMALFILWMLILILIVPFNNYAYIIGAVAIVLSLILACLFFYIIRKVQKIKSIPKKLNLQIRLVEVMNCLE
jgi:hypothetical protein